MVEIEKVKDVFKEYIIKQLDIMGDKSPALKLLKPIAKRVINNNINSFDKFLKPLADENGKIDIEGIFDEEMEIINTIDNFDFTIPYIGDGNISNGVVSFSLPYIDKGIALNQTDFETLKELLIQ